MPYLPLGLSLHQYDILFNNIEKANDRPTLRMQLPGSLPVFVGCMAASIIPRLASSRNPDLYLKDAEYWGNDCGKVL
jgi:hypothetical protein